MPTTHPLVYGVLELRVPFSPSLTVPDSAHRLATILGDLLPVLRQEQSTTLAPDPNGVMTLAPGGMGWRLLSVDSTRNLVLSNTSIHYETTRYPGYEVFCEEIRRCLSAIAEVAAPVGIDRLGLRYINEIRPEAAPTTYQAWSRSIAPTLVEAFTELETTMGEACSRRSDNRCELMTAESTLQFAMPENTALTLRMANLQGPGIVGNEPLRRAPVPDPGPFYVIDFDGYWPRQAAEVRAFDVDDMLGLIEQVHSPVKSAFNWATTADYRADAGVGAGRQAAE
ncbi:TIGR04255 family protein [Nocardioides sp. CER19]|uniref:TIGR04255 family protein n=1 Tax=Nocardioides sp. CER19 TaxID=3038538 RepID=UPI0024477420|nr:TIGR04255 family protein [Nocardioides sp. CER19]MDH2414341.1 TIGR04255 family protein [Nocardioides sp. CER19]